MIFSILGTFYVISLADLPKIIRMVSVTISFSHAEGVGERVYTYIDGSTCSLKTTYSSGKRHSPTVVTYNTCTHKPSTSTPSHQPHPHQQPIPLPRMLHINPNPPLRPRRRLPSGPRIRPIPHRARLHNLQRRNINRSPRALVSRIPTRHRDRYLTVSEGVDAREGVGIHVWGETDGEDVMGVEVGEESDGAGAVAEGGAAAVI